MAQSMERWKGKVALVTGASSGIGYGIAKSLACSGMKVIGCSRNIAKIEELAKELNEAGTEGCVVPMKCDVRNEEEIKSVFSRAKEELGGVDVCVNNAGVLFISKPLLSQTTEEYRQSTEVNIIATMVVTREYVKQMEERKCDDGHIININSVSGHRMTSRPAFVFYTATKYAVTALTEGVRIELRQKKSRIRVTSISPGFVRSEIIGRGLNLDKAATEEATVNMEGRVNTEEILEAEDIGSVIVSVLSAPQHVDINEVKLRSSTQVL